MQLGKWTSFGIFFSHIPYLLALQVVIMAVSEVVTTQKNSTFPRNTGK